MENLPLKQNPHKITKNLYEKTAWQDQLVVCGIDEVGRGCIAGPLVTAAVILPIGCGYRGLKDSKLMTAAEREKSFRWIISRCNFGIGIVSHKIIDKHNVWQATLIAMKKAVLNLLATAQQRPSALLVDAMPLKLLDTDYKSIPIYHFCKGESWSNSIAAASIVAKVTRDRLMRKFCPLFPGYRLANHKGYAAKSHKAAIQAQGHTIIHRMSFLGNTLNQKERENEAQQSLF